MTLAEVQLIPVPSSDFVKMEDRKRPASYDNDDPAPPQKRQATASMNGGSRGHQDADLPGKDDLEVSLSNLPSFAS
jgi:E3 ubiquitin-protein ligase BRE1